MEDKNNPSPTTTPSQTQLPEKEIETKKTRKIKNKNEANTPNKVSKKEGYKRKQQETSKYRKAVIELPEDGITVGNWDLYKSIKFTFPELANTSQEEIKIGSELNFYGIGPKILCGISVPKNGSLVSFWALDNSSQSINEMKSFGIQELVSIQSKALNEGMWNDFISLRNAQWNERKEKYKKTFDSKRGEHTTHSPSSASLNLLSQLEKKINDQEKRIAELEARNEVLEKENKTLLETGARALGENSILRSIFSKEYPELSLANLGPK